MPIPACMYAEMIILFRFSMGLKDPS